MSSEQEQITAGFTRHKLKSIKTLGEILREHRETVPMSLDKVARLINVEMKYLQALENNDYANLPAEPYVKNFLKKYSEVLGINVETAALIFKKEKMVFDNAQKKKEKISKFKNAINFLFSPTFLRIVLLILVALGILIYLGIKVYNITKPPELVIADLPTSFSTEEKSLTINGKSESEAVIKVNDRQIISDKNGSFNITLDLQKGLNIIKISAKTKHSREKVLYYQIVLNEIIK
ncbi:helix-turn-helix domain-containing protein [Candidatus Falkowbacteria bacterium]|nr:helix-turn-helix domain-containing protein [Candidatus Falkowbacteria bacterium]